MKYCPKCGRKLEIQSPYCPFCGASLTEYLQAQYYSKKKDRRKAIAAILGISGLLGLGFIAFRYYGDEIYELLNRIAGAGRTTTVTKTIELTEASETSTFFTTTYWTETTSSSTSTSSTSPLATSTTSALPSTSESSETTSTEVTSMTTRTTRATAVPKIPDRDWDRIIFPYIEVGGQAEYDQVEVIVSNRGSAPSFYTVMELYTGPVERIPGIKYVEYPLSSFSLAWRRVTTLNMGQRVDIDFSELPSSHEVLIWVCYDPILDPRNFRMDSDAQLRSVYRSSLDRDRHVMALGRSGVVEE
ncbi:MAG: zinc ribbon domain-containing protein [Thaumarchaeota archaeon]|nr:zinc ribbon domain-containing protein [Nitrososphaerota archaeon]